MYNLIEFVKVVYGRESSKEDYKVTIIIDPSRNRGGKVRQEIQHEFYFES